MTVQLRVAAPTWARFEEACEALGAHPDHALGTPALPALPEGAAQGEALLGAILERSRAGAALKAGRASELAGRAFFAEAAKDVARATARTKRHADRCGVWEVMQQKGGGGPSIGRALAGLEPAGYQSMRHMRLKEMMAYLGLRSVDHISRNLEDHL